MYRIIEHFALGRRRLELFGEDHNIRAGWLTVGNGLSSSNFNTEVKFQFLQLVDHLVPVPLFLVLVDNIGLTIEFSCRRYDN